MTEVEIVWLTLLIAIFVLWEQLRWLKRIAAALGCHPHRTRRLEELGRKLGFDPFVPRHLLKLTEAQRKELDEEFLELAESQEFQTPAQVGQLKRIIELLMELTQLQKAALGSQEPA